MSSLLGDRTIVFMQRRRQSGPPVYGHDFTQVLMVSGYQLEADSEGLLLTLIAPDGTTVARGLLVCPGADALFQVPPASGRDRPEDVTQPPAAAPRVDAGEAEDDPRPRADGGERSRDQRPTHWMGPGNAAR